MFNQLRHDFVVVHEAVRVYLMPTLNWMTRHRMVLLIMAALFLSYQLGYVHFNLPAAGARLLEHTESTKITALQPIQVEKVGGKTAHPVAVATAARPTPEPTTPSVAADYEQIVFTMPAVPTPSGDGKAANTFSNLGFILSPATQQKLGVPQLIVDRHRTHCETYVKRFAPIAVAEMKAYGIPASIKLAQGLLESNAGDSRLAQHNNNHFGIKCFSRQCSRGHCSNFHDDTHKDFFRKYDTAWESYRAHSEFLQKDRYKALQQYGTRDYQSWAYGLRQAGYATDKQYAEKLIRIIRRLRLDRFDRM